MLEAVFTSGVDEIEVSGLTQWDRGQAIKVVCPDITSLYQVHFAFKGGKEALVLNVATSDTAVEIPDELLRQPHDLVAWVYAVYSDGSAETVKTINLPVTRRAKPKDYTAESSPSEIARIEAMLSELHGDTIAIAERAENTAEEALEAASEALAIVDAATQQARESVRYTAQTLTDDQKRQARENIGAVDEVYVTNAINTALGDYPAALSALDSVIGGVEE